MMSDVAMKMRQKGNDIWIGLPADMILRGEVSGWRTVLKDIQRYISN